MLNEHQPYFDGIVRQISDWGLGAEFRYAGALDRAGKIALAAGDGRHVHAGDVRRTQGFHAASKRWPTASPSSSPIAARSPRSSGAPAAGCWCKKDDPDALADGLFALLTDRARAATLARAGVEGVHRHYTVEAMAEAAERVYRTLIAADMCL